VPEIVCVMLHWKETLWFLKIHQSGLRRKKLENLKKSQQKLCNEIEDWKGKMSYGSHHKQNRWYILFLSLECGSE
jgi:hypothetical protein